MRIVSMLPGGTEIVCALGLMDDLVGVSHECDFPPEVRKKPAVVHPRLDPARMTPAEIDRAVSETLRTGGSLYRIDEALLEELKPDLILTQNLCEVCAPAVREVAAAARVLRRAPEVLYLTPRRLEEVFQNILEVGRAAGVEPRAQALLAGLRARLDRVAEAARGLPRPRVFCMEWLDPPYNAGHWMPELVERAGGEDALAAPGAPSVRTPWDRIVAYAPEVFVFAPCGYPLEAAVLKAQDLRSRPGWKDLPATPGRARLGRRRQCLLRASRPPIGRGG